MGKRELKRTLGLWDILMFGIGGMIGAGIYDYGDYACINQ